MRGNLIVLIIIVFGILIGSDVLWPQKKIPKVKIGNRTVFVEIARTSEERLRGLSYRRELAENQGMLFVFPTKSYQAFWMKGMNFDLDFIWIADSKVVDITENVPSLQGNIPDEALPVYRSRVPVDAMLEVDSGFVIEHKIKIGDLVILNLEEK